MGFEHLVSKLGYLSEQERIALAMYGVLPSVTKRVQAVKNVKLPGHDEPALQAHPAMTTRQMTAVAVSGGRPTFVPPKHGIPAAKQSGPATAAATPVAMPSPAAAAAPRKAVAMPSSPRGGARAPAAGTRPVSMPSGASRAAPSGATSLTSSGGPPGKPPPQVASGGGAPLPPMPPAASGASSDGGGGAAAVDYSSDATAATAASGDETSAAGNNAATAGSGVWKWVAGAAVVFLLLRR